MKITHIYNLVAFSSENIDVQTEQYKKGQIEWERIKDMTKDERESYRLAKPLYIPDIRLFIGKAYRGSWTYIEDLINLIEKSPSYICEAYYDFLCIECHRIGELDACSTVDKTNHELWFKLEVPDGAN